MSSAQFKRFLRTFIATLLVGLLIWLFRELNVAVVIPTIPGP